MKNYLLNVWGSEKFNTLDSNQKSEFFKNYGTWVESLKSNNQLISGFQINSNETSSVQNIENTPKLINEPYHSGSHNLAGIFIVKAENKEQVFEMTKTCPSVKDLDETIEIIELT